MPSFVDITPAVIHYEYKKNKEVKVNVTNLTTNSVTITPKSILCEMQPVKVDESVFERIEHTQEAEDIFKSVNIESTLTQDQSNKIKELLRKHKDIFAKNDTDIGNYNVIKHRIDLMDNTPFKQAHRRIPPNMSMKLDNTWNSF